MSARDVFVDTGAFHALLVSNDPLHPSAVKCLQAIQNSRRGLVTTDYVLDESATLLKARGVGAQIPRLFDLVERSRALTIKWVAEDRFALARDFMIRHHDHSYSFTDCASFVVMRELEIRDALTADRHYREAGFRPLLTGHQSL